MSTLVQQRCMVHPDRAAAVRCPFCQGFYCRECVIEHRGKMMCTQCVTGSEAAPELRGSSLAAWGVLAVAGFCMVWLVFYYCGMGLARIPASFFGGTP